MKDRQAVVNQSKYGRKEGEVIVSDNKDDSTFGGIQRLYDIRLVCTFERAEPQAVDFGCFDELGDRSL